MEVRDILSELKNNISLTVSKQIDSSDIPWEAISEVGVAVSQACQKLSLTNKVEVKYGRYLVCREPAFNIQLDVFSSNYLGAPHNHETWGVMGIISGSLGIEDYELKDGKLFTLRKGVLTNGSAVGFRPFSDWHSTETFDLPQVASFHVYGLGFNIDEGYRYSDRSGIEKYERGTLHSMEQNLSILESEI